MLGNGRLEAMCFDGVKRLCHIRGKLRKKVWINQSDIILVGLRDYQVKAKSKLGLCSSSCILFRMPRPTLFLNILLTRPETLSLTESSLNLSRSQTLLTLLEAIWMTTSSSMMLTVMDPTQQEIMTKLMTFNTYFTYLTV